MGATLSPRQVTGLGEYLVVWFDLIHSTAINSVPDLSLKFPIPPHLFIMNLSQPRSRDRSSFPKPIHSSTFHHRREVKDRYR